MLDKKQIQVIFLIEFKMGWKAVETTHNINNAFGLRTANEHTVQGCFKKFCQGNESLEDEERSDQPLRLTMTNWEPSSKLILLQIPKKLPKNSTTTILWSFGILKMLYKWVPPGLTKNRETVILFYTTPMNHFSIELWCVREMDFIRQPVITSSVAGPRRSPRALPKAKLAPKKGHGHCLMVCYWPDPLQLSESWWNNYIWEVCSANPWDAQKTPRLAAGTGQQKGTKLHDNARAQVTQPTLQKLNELGYKVLPHLPYSPDLSPTDYHIFKHLDNFLQRKCFHNEQKTENAFFRVRQIPKHRFLCKGTFSFFLFSR